MSGLDLVIGRLELFGARVQAGHGDTYVAQCPAHDDHNPSLVVSRGTDGRVLVHCHAGCTYEEILNTLGLESKDLMPELEEDAQELAAYSYTDENGTLLYQVVRYVPKAFRQRRPDGNGGWLWNMEGVRRVLYRLPIVLDAVKCGATIWIAEGEKDADTLVNQGVCATTPLGGAGKWRSEYADTLKGATKVVIVADADEPGRKHARVIADSLAPLVGNVGVVESPSHKDATDHLVAGLGLRDFRLTYRPGGEAPTRRVNLFSANKVRVRPVRWIWEGRMPAGALTLLAGREGGGKSSCAYDVAASLTRGVLPGCCYGHPRSVIVAATEDSWEHTIAPRLMAARAELGLVYRVEVESSEGPAEVVLPVDLDELVRVGKDVGAALFLLDPLLSRLSPGLDTHKDAEVRRALEPLVRASNQADWATVGIIHLSKAAVTDPLQMVMGSRAFPAVARSVLFVGNTPNTHRRRMLGQIKNNLGQFAPSLFFEIEGERVADTPEGPVWTSRVRWGDESTLSVPEILQGANAERLVETTFSPAIARSDLF